MPEFPPGQERPADTPADAVDPARTGQVDDALTGSGDGSILLANGGLQLINGCLLLVHLLSICDDSVASAPSEEGEEGFCYGH